MSFSEQEIEEFKAEALELLDVSEKSLLSMDQGGDFRDAFDAIFRGFHNLKGASGMMELTLLQSHMHELENILMKFKEGTSIPKEYISLFLRGVDAARSILNEEAVEFDFTVKSSIAEPAKVARSLIEAPAEIRTDEASLLPDSAKDEFITECDEIVARVSDLMQKVETKNFSTKDIEALYRDIHSLKGTSYLFSCNDLGHIAHAMESSLEKVRDATHLPTEDLLNGLFKCIELIDLEIEAIKTKTKVVGIERSIQELQEMLEKATLNLPLVVENKVETQPEPIVSAVIKSTPLPRETPMKTETPAPPAVAAPSESASPANPKEKEVEGNGSIRVPVALLDNLMTLMGEMVLVRNQVLQFSSQSEDLEFLNLSKRLNVVTSEIQGEMMKTRMQPIGNILTKFNRVVRDLSHELKKDINLVLSGAETELDKSLLEAIKDPLTHIVRNSCDHGIETPEVRTRAGKSKNGTITIRSYHEGGQVVIEIFDDGKGLHKDMLVKKALEKGLITQGQVASMSEKEIFNLIFAPGFSTAAAVTNVSGRGVGMDVVRTNVEKIGGTVELNSVVGKGTSTKLKIPLTLAIVPALIVKCGKGAFAIPQVKLEELVRVDAASSADNKIEYLHGAPVYRLRGSILPLVNLNQILGLKTPEGEVPAGSNIAVLTADQCTFGLLIDEVQDTADIVVKPINRLLKSLQVYSGATILGDGSIALIIDVLGIAKVAQIGSDASKVDEAKNQANQETKNRELQEYLLVRVGSKTKHAIVLGYVHRLEEFNRSEIEYSGVKPVIRYGKTILPLISVQHELEYSTKSDAAPREKIPVVVIEKAGALYGLEVEEIVDTLSTEVEIDTSLVKQPGLFGNLNTPEELIVAIDPYEIIEKAFPETTVVPRELTHAREAGKINQAFNKKLRILLVEDTVFFRKAIAAALETAGHAVTMAIDGQDAMEILEKGPDQFDMVVSDIEMPRMNGFELAKAIRAHQSLSRMPMLAISSKADKKYTERGRESGFDIYIEKLKPKVLLDAISLVNENHRRAV